MMVRDCEFDVVLWGATGATGRRAAYHLASRCSSGSGLWVVVLLGHLDDGSVIQIRVEGAGDPGVESTSRMLVESALCLAEDSDRIAVGGGIWTPASAMGDLLLPRLTSHAGLSFQLV
jgi:saccharopine dehydrogenase (NAD+, L-glutamate forming)